MPEELVSECCWKTYQASKASKRVIDHIDHSLSDPYGLAHQDVHHQPLATRIWLSLDRPQHSYRAKVRTAHTAALLKGQGMYGAYCSTPTGPRYVWSSTLQRSYRAKVRMDELQHSYRAKVRLGQVTELL